jgi:formamidopyrimidine-DNA glycosylase
MVKCWLMDQSILAGLGNIYSDEVLFQAGIAPQRKLESLDEADLKRLHARMRKVIDTAIEHGADPKALPGSFLLPNRREGAPCPRCGGTVVRTRACGRTAWYCPDCQRS